MTADVCVVGLGYVGLPTAALFADGGHRVTGVDINPLTVETLRSGQIHIVEPGLDEVVRRVVAAGQLTVSMAPVPSDAFMIAVPTPLDEEHAPDLRHVMAAVTAIAPVLVAGNLVVLESTSPIGATEKVAALIDELRPDLGTDGVHIAYCPERVLPGNVLVELVENDRIIGGLTPAASQRAAALYATVVRGARQLTTARVAEFSKLAENAYRDVNIAFANELSLIAHEVDVDPLEVIELANLHPRVDILRPGAGVGGHCIAVDPWFLVAASDVADLITTARQVNDAKPSWVVDRVADAAADLERAVVVCLGLAYKPDIDDVRESPAVEVVRLLAECGDYEVLAVDPHLELLPARLEGAAVQLVEVGDALERADVVVALVGHRAFSALSVDLIARLPAERVVDPSGVFRSVAPVV